MLSKYNKKISTVLILLGAFAIVLSSGIFIYRNKFVSTPDIFVATPSGTVVLQVQQVTANPISPSSTVRYKVVATTVPAGLYVSAIGFTLKFTGVPVPTVYTKGSAISDSFEVKEWVVNGSNLSFVAATASKTLLNLTANAEIATFEITAPATVGTYSGAITSVVTSALPSVISVANVEVLKDTSFAPVSLVVINSNPSPVGFLDTATCTSFTGWTCDSSNYATALTVHLYADGVAGTGTFLGQTTANISRTDISGNCGGVATHGFTFNTTSSLKDGRAHTIYAYALDIPGGAGVTNPILTGSPKTITCSQPTLAKPVFNITSDTIYNSSVSVSVDVPGITGETIKYCTTTSNTTPCTPSITVTPGTAFNFSNASPVYLYAQATLTGYTSNTAYSPKLTLNDTPVIPSLTYVNASGNTNLVYGDTVTLTVSNVTDSIPAGGVKTVTFYKVEGATQTQIGTPDTTAPYTATFTSAPIGSYQFKAEAVDASSGRGSLSVSVTVKPLKPTFNPNGGTSATPFSVTLTNPNGTGTIKYSLGDNVTPSTTYSSPISVSTSNKVTANVTVGTITSDNAVSNQFTITGKVAAPVISPVSGAYIYNRAPGGQRTSITLSSATTGASILYCLGALTSTTCTSYVAYTTPILIDRNFRIYAKATKAGWSDSDVSGGP